MAVALRHHQPLAAEKSDVSNHLWLVPPTLPAPWKFPGRLDEHLRGLDAIVHWKPAFNPAAGSSSPPKSPRWGLRETLA